MTKELNELVAFDFKTKQFQLVVGESGGDDAMGAFSAVKTREELESPGLKQKGKNTNASPAKLGNTMSKTATKSPSKLTSKARRAGKSPSKKGDGFGDKDQEESGLSSPTSVSMQNTFIIKNADESFDAYYQQMRKRKLGQGQGTGGQTALLGGDTMGGVSATLQGQSPGAQESNFGVVAGISPAARDGHSSEISADGLMFVFGGDRHHMPFNDLYLMKLN